MKNKWQPIKTAPKDGTKVLAFEQSKYYPIFHVASWNKDDHFWFVARKGEGYEEQIITIHPSHWQPLPQPPEVKND